VENNRFTRNAPLDWLYEINKVPEPAECNEENEAQ